jgi:hypothetical protein
MIVVEEEKEEKSSLMESTTSLLVSTVITNDERHPSLLEASVAYTTIPYHTINPIQMPNKTTTIDRFICLNSLLPEPEPGKLVANCFVPILAPIAAGNYYAAGVDAVLPIVCIQPSN